MKPTPRVPPLVWLAAVALLPACGTPTVAPETAPVPPPPPLAAAASQVHAPPAAPGPLPWDPFDSQLGQAPRRLPTLRYYTLPG
jgi:hypothetical protein